MPGLRMEDGGQWTVKIWLYIGKYSYVWAILRGIMHMNVCTWVCAMHMNVGNYQRIYNG
jgi:hypothetical protein